MPDEKEKPYHTTGCRFCHWSITHPALELVDLAKLDGQAPRKLEEFHGKLLGHIQRCADDEEAQIAQVLKQHRKKMKPEPEPDLSAAKHHAAWIECRNRIMFAQSTAILSAFNITDPALLAIQDIERWTLHQATRKFYFTDEVLIDRLQPLQLSPAVQDQVFKLVSEIRDVLVEQGLYAPGQAGAAIATASATGRPG